MPRVLIQGIYFFGAGGGPTGGRNYDVTADGQRFLMLKEASATSDEAAPSQINVVLNWFEELKRLVPID